MEKEQRKLLLVAVSTGVFLLITITAAIMMLTPKIQPQNAVFSSAGYSAGTIIPVETVNDTAQPVINNSQETKIYIEGNPDPIAIDKNNGDNLTIQIPKPNTPAVSDSLDNTPSAAKTQTFATAVKPAAVQPAKTQVSTAGKTASTAKTATASSGKTAAKTINDYWIQTGAFSAMFKAEDVKETLLSKGLTSIIENREIDGKTLYRVRLGPYTTEKEANYWLTLVKSIDGFGDSQVRQTTRQQ
jgi:DedD protein